MEKVGFAFLVISCSIMSLLAMDQQQPQQQNQQQELTEVEINQLRRAIMVWVISTNRPTIEQFVAQHPNLARLKKLNLGVNNIGYEGAQHLGCITTT